MTAGNTHQPPIRRLPDGSIDAEHYEAIGRGLRSESMRQPLVGFLSRLAERACKAVGRPATRTAPAPYPSSRTASFPGS